MCAVVDIAMFTLASPPQLALATVLDSPSPQGVASDQNMHSELQFCFVVMCCAAAAKALFAMDTALKGVPPLAASAWTQVCLC